MPTLKKMDYSNLENIATVMEIKKDVVMQKNFTYFQIGYVSIASNIFVRKILADENPQYNWLIVLTETFG